MSDMDADRRDAAVDGGTGSGAVPSRPGVRAVRRWAAVLLAAAMVALFSHAIIEFRLSGLARSTFLFYYFGSGEKIIEERMLGRSSGGERDMVRYVEEALLGPASPAAEPLFPRGTRLRSLLFRDGVVYADISADAMLWAHEGEGLLRGFETLGAGLRRNFPRVEDVRFFVDGRAAFAGESLR